MILLPNEIINKYMQNMKNLVSVCTYLLFYKIINKNHNYLTTFTCLFCVISVVDSSRLCLVSPVGMAKNVLIHRESLIYKVIDTNNHEKEDY
jgi:hypothetical protein